MWQTKYAAAIPKNLGVGVNFRPCSEGYYLSGRPQSVILTIHKDKIFCKSSLKTKKWSSKSGWKVYKPWVIMARVRYIVQWHKSSILMLITDIIKKLIELDRYLCNLKHTETSLNMFRSIYIIINFINCYKRSLCLMQVTKTELINEANVEARISYLWLSREN